MTWAKLRDMIWEGLGTDSTDMTDLVNDAVILNNMLTAWEYDIIKRVILLSRERWDDYLKDLVGSNTANGTGSTLHWDLPSDFFDGGDYIVTVDSKNADKVSPEYKRISDVNSLYRPDSLIPKYYIFNNDIYFITAPASGTNNVVLYYIKNPTGTNGSSPEVASKLHQSAVYYCLRECFKIDGDDLSSAAMNAKYLQECEAMII